MEFPLLHFFSRATHNALTFKRGDFSSVPTGGTKLFMKDHYYMHILEGNDSSERNSSQCSSYVALHLC